jgi:hypothetical protein
MMPPPSAHQPLPPQPTPPSFADVSPIAQETPHVAQPQDAETVETTCDFTAFTNVRVHPYRRDRARCQAPGPVPSWVKKKASARTLNSREAQREQTILEKDHEDRDGPGRSRAQQDAERPVEEQVAAASRELNDRYYAQAAQFITSLCERQIGDLTQAEWDAQARIDAVKELDMIIDQLHSKLKELKIQRSQYPANRKVLDGHLQEASDAKAFVVQRHRDILAGLHLMMQQLDHDFFSAWKAIQARFNLPSDLWPTGVAPPTSTQQSSPTPPSSSTFDTVPLVNPEHDHAPAGTSVSSSDKSSSSPSPPSSSSLPSSSTPSSSSPLKYLSTSRPRNDEERFARYILDWDLLLSKDLAEGHATFEQTPWPVLFDVNKDGLDTLNLESIKEFILHPSYPSHRTAAGVKESIKLQEFRWWHPDKIARLLPKFVADDRAAVKDAVNKVFRLLDEIRKNL